MLPQKSYKILLIGDSCIDVYLYGEVSRLNPEAPVPILDYKRKEVREGMALNVFNNLIAFGLVVDLFTNSEKSIKTRFIDQKTNQQILRLDEEVNISEFKLDDIKENYDAIVISDYNKGYIQPESLFKIVEEAKCPVFIDSKKKCLPKENCFIKINDLEYKNLQGDHRNLIITHGSNGAEYMGINYPAEKVNVYDVVGAGDTFLSALVYGYLTYNNIGSAIKLANKAAAIAVQNQGTYVLTKKDVQSICN